MTLLCRRPTPGRVETGRLEHTPEAIAAWLTAVAHRFHGEKIGVAIETSRGAIVHALLEAPFVVIYPINPRSLKRFREAFSPNGAKDDEPDARLLLALLVKHRAQLQPLSVDDVATRTLQRLVQHRRDIVDLRTRIRPPSVRSPSKGSASCGAAGRTGLRATTRAMCARWHVAARPSRYPANSSRHQYESIPACLLTDHLR